MKVAYFDCFAGASGDMILGALLDAGLDLDRLKNELAKLHLSHYDIQAKQVVRRGLGGTQTVISVEEDHHTHHHRHLHDIKEIIEKSSLEESVKQQSVEIFTRLAAAEAKVHQTAIEQIHFHEVGAMDAIIDVVGAVIGLNALEVEKIVCSPIHVGKGTVKCAHGVLPVPAPATLELVRGRPIYATDVEGELLTPTGAAILTTLASHFGYLPSISMDKVGYGAGTSDPGIPNLLRVLIGDSPDHLSGYEVEQVAVTEASIDDMNPQVYEYLIEKLLKMGALDVFLSSLHMKKNRPGTLVTVICYPEMIEGVSDFLLKETTTIGLRWRVDNRIKVGRAVERVETRFGPVECKFARARDRLINVSPEYEDCKRLARELNVPLKEVINEARSAASRSRPPE